MRDSGVPTKSMLEDADLSCCLNISNFSSHYSTLSLSADMPAATLGLNSAPTLMPHFHWLLQLLAHYSGEETRSCNPYWMEVDNNSRQLLKEGHGEGRGGQGSYYGGMGELFERGMNKKDE
jgi:hypothetical protein